MRPAEPEELVPWDAIYEMAENEEAAPHVPQQHLDLGEPARPAPPAPEQEPDPGQNGAQQEEEPVPQNPNGVQHEEEPAVPEGVE